MGEECEEVRVLSAGGCGCGCGRGFWFWECDAERGEYGKGGECSEGGDYGGKFAVGICGWRAWGEGSAPGLECLGEFHSGLESLCGKFVEAFAGDASEFGREIWREVMRERGLTGKECAEEASEGMHIGGGCELAGREEDLFGGGPGWSTAAGRSVGMGGVGV